MGNGVAQATERGVRYARCRVYLLYSMYGVGQASGEDRAVDFWQLRSGARWLDVGEIRGGSLMEDRWGI